MKKLMLLALVGLLSLSTQAQHKAGNKNDCREKNHRGFNSEDFRKKIEVHKIAYITKELDLTKEEAQKFWPIYNQYESELRAIREKSCPMMKDTIAKKEMKHPDLSKMSDKEAKDFVEKQINMEKDLAALKEKYAKQFETVIPIQKVASLLMLEKKFMSKLMQMGPKGEKMQKCDGEPNHKAKHKGCDKPCK